MSVQNSLKRPTFTKSVMGYAQGEVEKYIDHVTERYNSVCRENAELKRRVMALGVRLDEATDRINELERECSQTPVVTEGGRYDALGLEGLIISLENEKRRSEAVITEIQDKLRLLASESAPSGDETSACDTWEALGKFILEASADLPEAEEKTVSEVRTVEISDSPLPEIVLDRDVGTSALTAPDALLLPEVKLENKEAILTEEAPSEPEKTSKSAARAKTPLEIADELDFYPLEDEEDDEDYEESEEEKASETYDSIEDEAWKKMLADLIASAPLEAELEEKDGSDVEDGLDLFTAKKEAESESSYEPETDDSWKKMLAELIAIAPDGEEEPSEDEEISDEAPETDEAKDAEEPEETEEIPELEEIEDTEELPELEEIKELPELEEIEELEELEEIPELEEIKELPEIEEISGEEALGSPASDAQGREKTARELADELDFYSDDVHADGESFDPMALAVEATSKGRRPMFEFFMGDDYFNGKKK